MSDGNITLQELKDWAHSIKGTTLETRAQHKKFLFSLDDKGFYYTPESSGIRRRQKNSSIEKFLKRYNEQRYPNPGNYKDSSHHASYLLAVIDRYINS